MHFENLPKIELHLHLDCSLSYDVVRKIDPSITEEMYKSSFIAPARCTDLVDYISRANNAIDIMQTMDQLKWVTEDLFDQLQKDHIIYAEIRFAPLLHIQKGLSPAAVVQVVNDAAVASVARTGVEARLILCTLRHYSEAQSMETVQLVEQFKGTLVAGFDIAADEAGFPIDEHIKAFAYAREKEIPCTAHAGEAKGAESVWETCTHFKPSRIGHGVRSSEDVRLLEYLKEQDIHLEICPTSNLQTNIYQNISAHPIDRIYKSGVSMSVNTDCKTITPVTLSSEYALIAHTFHWETENFLHCNLEAIRHAFIPEALKERLTEIIRSAYKP